MKRIYTLILSLFFIMIAQYDAFAQYASSTPNNETAQLQLNKSYTGQGQGMVNTGKTLFYTGGSIALTGLACFIYGTATYESDPCCPEMPVYPIFALAGAVAGGAVALIGLPFYVYGKNKMETYGANHIVFGNPEQEGGAGFFEMGLGIPNFLSLDAIGGYNFGKNFFMGAGVGYKAFLTGGLVQSEGVMASFPIYANARYTIGNKRVAPYVGISAGYDIGNSGLYSGVEFGTRFRCVNGKHGASWWFGTKTEMTSPEIMFMSIKVGRSF
ncbi:MAG: hypothetical protein IKU36_07070 [Bacteroidales bacterium]|nr:hypothetical protein [Bacteroidales bacterium]